MPRDECLNEDVVSRLVEGSLEGALLSSAEEHLARCDACLRLVAEVDALTSDPRGGGGPEEPAGDDEGPVPAPPLVRGVEVGRYVILEPIGAGGMGRVYAAHDPALNRKVALKLLHRFATAPELETRLLREAQAMARLAHPEVITVHDVGRFGDQLFIAMELVDGGTLRQWAAARPRTWREVLDVFLRAGRGLARAHAAGIIHRDFKPDNVLVAEDGRVRVTDFGLAMTARDEAPPAEGEAPMGIDAAAPLTRTGAFVGTPAYMAPEQMLGKPADERSDLYGYCVALWEALYGERPFFGKTFAEQRVEKVEGKVRSAHAGRAVPPRLRRALLVGLRPAPADRYESMNALLVALEGTARTPRAPVVLGAVGAVLLVGAGIAFGARSPHRVASATTSAAAAQGCKSNAACVDAHGGGPWVCRGPDGACVSLASEDCAPLFEPGDLRASDTIWLGALFPTKGPSAAGLGKPNLDAADLARQEIASATSSLAGSSASVRVRRIALVGCDDSGDPMRAAKHLVDDVGVPAILGFRSGKEILDVAGSFLIQRRVLTMATLTQSAAIKRLPQPPDLPRLVWRTTNNLESAGAAMAHVVHEALEPRVKAKPVRVVLVRNDDATSLMPFAEAFYRTLTFNGRSAVENGANYQEITLPAHDAPLDAPASAARVAAAAPTFIVTLADAARTAALAEAIERQWPASAPRPTYLIASDSTSILHDFLGKSAERRRRVLAISPAEMPTATGRFLMRFDASHPGEATPTINPGSTYDGVYALAYAAFALGDAPATGPALATGLARLAGPGPHVESGPTDLFTGIASLVKGESIDLSGPSGALDFDRATGEIVTDYSLLCPGLDADGRASGDVESGVVYVGSERKTTGTVRCP